VIVVVDSSIYDNIVINTYACVVFSIVGLSIVSDLHNLISNKLFKIKNVFGFSSAVIYISLFLAISYFFGVLFISVHYGEFVLVDETIMNTLFWGSLGTARAVHFAYTVSSIILVVIFKYYIYEPDTEKQG
jgi:hypothetical protein